MNNGRSSGWDMSHMFEHARRGTKGGKGITKANPWPVSVKKFPQKEFFPLNPSKEKGKRSKEERIGRTIGSSVAPGMLSQARGRERRRGDLSGLHGATGPTLIMVHRPGD